MNFALFNKLEVIYLQALCRLLWVFYLGDCYGSLVMPSSSPWRSFFSQFSFSKENLQALSASQLFSLTVSIFAAVSPSLVNIADNRGTLTQADANLFAHRIFDVVHDGLITRRCPPDLWY